MAYIGRTPLIGNFQVCDAITVVNGQAAYTLQVSSTDVSPESVNHMLVSLNGILQAPTTSFSVAGATLTFVSNLATGDVIDFVILLGNVLDLGTPSDGVVTNAKLAQDIISGETALAAVPATTDELLISDAGTLKRIDAQYFQNTPAFSCHLSGNQSISTGSHTKVTIDSEDLDTDGKFASNKFTPTVAGWYLITVFCRFDSGNDMTNAQVAIYKNGSKINKHTEGSIEVQSKLLSQLVYLDSDDYVEMYVKQDTGGSININGGSYESQDVAFFQGHKLIGI